MNLTSPSQVKSWCIEHDFHPNKTLGQNFLIDRNVLDAIVAAGLEGAQEGEAILEIGPGLGVMTQGLLERGHRVVAIEKDAFLCEGLAERVGGSAAALRIVGGDALDPAVMAQALDALGEAPARGRTLVSNLPYQAGTRILLELVEKRGFRAMTVLLQTEVAQRLAAPEGGRERSLAGVLAQLDYDVEIVRKVSASCFWPRPEVGSAVARLVRHERNAGLGESVRQAYRRLAKQAFAHRRKQLGTIFKGAVESTARAEQLSVADWVALAEKSEDFANTGESQSLNPSHNL